MAWRPTEYLEAGELDNTNSGKVTGWMKFAGLRKRVKFDLTGNFHRDIRGAKIRFTGDALEEVDKEKAKDYMTDFSLEQTGNTGDMTAGLPPVDYVSYPYIEWYGDDNGRVVIELESNQIEVIGTPIPAIESDPISRDEQHKNMGNFLDGMIKAIQKK